MSLLTLNGSMTTRVFTYISGLSGVQDPTLSVNAFPPEPYGTSHPLLDISKQMSAWDSASGDIDWMIANGYVSAATTWITSSSIPTPFWKTITPDGLDTFYDGKQYRMRWAGAGTMVLNSGGTTNSTSANEVLFTYTGGNMQVRATSGPITDLSIVEVSKAARFDAGERIDPDYAALVADMRMIRFMDWNHTNSTTQTTWASRPVPSQNSYTPEGNGNNITNAAAVPLELMVELCNKVKADMYFCFPHAADDTYVTNAATYIRDNLNPDLVCTFERSNEVWNFGFTIQQSHFLALGQALWPDADGVENPQVIRLSALGYQTYQDAQLIDAVYSGILSRRQIAINVQTDFSQQGINTLDATTWQDYAGNANSTSGPYTAPYTAITHLAVTSYYGTGMLTAPRQSAIEAAYPATSDAVIEGYLREAGATGDDITALPWVQSYWSTYNAIAIARGIKMMLYEGGPHMVFATGTQSQTVRDAVRQWIDSSLGATFATDIYDAWAALSEAEAPFMQFQDIGSWSQFGQWTIWEHQGDTPAGYMAQILTENETTANWWGDDTDHRHGEL